MSENGLAWLGGGALALGGALLAAFAAQRGWFTPALRIGAAAGLGPAMLAAGEAIRRRTQRPGGPHRLAAAMASAAGAVTLYAAIWAAYALYHFMGVPVAASLLAAVSLGLLALAAIHGEPLGLLAILGAFAAPAICNPPSWNGVALDGYLVLILATGLAAMSRRGWGWVGLVSLATVAVWIADRVVDHDVMGAAGLLTAAPALALLAASAARQTSKASARTPMIAVIGATVLWAAMSASAASVPGLAPSLVGAALAILAAAAIAQGFGRPWLLAAPALGLVVVALGADDLYFSGHAAPGLLWLLLPVGALAAAGLGLTMKDRKLAPAGVIAAVGAALAMTLLRGLLANAVTTAWGGALFVAIAVLFALGATLIARRSPDTAHDLALAAWIGAAAEILGLAIHTGLAGRPEPLAYGLLALGLALLARRLPWRGLAEASALATLVSLLALLGPRIAGDALRGRLGSSDLAWTGGLAVALHALTWRALKTPNAPGTAREAVSTTATVTGLLTLFLSLRLLATANGHAAAPLGPFTETALRTVLLLAAGLVLSVRGGPSTLSRWRGPVFLALGVAHGALLGGLLLNPWWGAPWWADWGSGWLPRERMAGPPVLDAIALAYLAPTLLLAAAVRRPAGRPAWARPGAAAAALGFLVLWVVMEVRRLFHGEVLATGPFGYAETAAYGVGLLAIAWSVTLAAERTTTGRAFSWAPTAAAIVRWSALVLAAWLICVGDSAWWGPLAGPFTAPWALFALQAGAIGLTAAMALGGRAPHESALGRGVRTVVVLEMFTLLTLAIRFAFHGGDMRSRLVGGGVETWTYSAAWAVYGLAVLIAAARTGDRPLRWLGLGVLLGTTAKVFLFDTSALEGVIRAASFLALGALLLIGALAARRLGTAKRVPGSGEGQSGG